MRQSTMGCAGPGSISWDNSVLSTITWLPAWALKHGTCVALVRSASLILSAKAPSDQSGVCGRSCKLFACIFQQHPTTSKLPECSFGLTSHHCVKSGSLLPEMVAGWNRFFHNIPSVQDSQGPREEAKSYRPAIPSSLACRPLVQGHNYFIYVYIHCIDAKEWGASNIFIQWQLQALPWILQGGLHIRNGVAGKHFQDAQATATHCSYLGPFSSCQK